jgi:hypothetical protein
MKRKCILLVLALGFLTLCQTSFAIPLPIDLDPPDPNDPDNTYTSLWVELSTGSAPDEPDDFDGMTLFYALGGSSSSLGLEYYVYGPSNYSGRSTTSTDAPALVDLSIFRGENVVFEFRNTGSEIITFQEAGVNDYGINGGEFGLKGVAFYFGFYENANTDGWLSREVVEYIDGISGLTEPDHGKEFFYGVSNYSGFIRSDFQAAPVPEPGTLLLLASGIAALAGSRKRLKKK